VIRVRDTLDLGLGVTHLFLSCGCGLPWSVALGLISPGWLRELGDAAGARSSFQAFQGATMVGHVTAKQTLQAAIAFSRDSMLLQALVVMFAAIMCGATSIAFDQVLGSLASF
jgi:hypothetical protein